VDHEATRVDGGGEGYFSFSILFNAY